MVGQVFLINQGVCSKCGKHVDWNEEEKKYKCECGFEWEVVKRTIKMR